MLREKVEYDFKVREYYIIYLSTITSSNSFITEYFYYILKYIFL